MAWSLRWPGSVWLAGSSAIPVYQAWTRPASWKGVTEDDMAPVLEALFAGAGAVKTDQAVDVLLSETPVMGNLVRCGLQGLIR